MSASFHRPPPRPRFAGSAWARSFDAIDIAAEVEEAGVALMHAAKRLRDCPLDPAPHREAREAIANALVAYNKFVETVA